jgi:hypothetical protein
MSASTNGSTRWARGSPAYRSRRGRLQVAFVIAVAGLNSRLPCEATDICNGPRGYCRIEICLRNSRLDDLDIECSCAVVCFHELFVLVVQPRELRDNEIVGRRSRRFHPPSVDIKPSNRRALTPTSRKLRRQFIHAVDIESVGFVKQRPFPEQRVNMLRKLLVVARRFCPLLRFPRALRSPDMHRSRACRA